MKSLVFFVSASIASAGLVAASTASFAQNAPAYPTKTITLIVPFPAGGGPDLLARILAEKIASKMGQAIIVDNKPGAGALLGAGYVAKSAPDGYTLLLTPNTLAISPFVLPKGAGGGLDIVRDLAPVIAPVTTPMVLVANPSLGVTNLDQLVSLAKKSPGLPFATPGNGSPMHFAGEMFKKSAHVDMLHVPYRGVGPAMTAVVGGEVKLMYVGLGGVTPMLKSGKLVALAATEKTRSTLAPQIPTATEQGYPGVEVNSWFGIFAPTATPPAVIARINQEVNDALKIPDVRERLAMAGLEATGGTPQVLAAYVKEDTERYGKLAQELNIKAD